MIWDRIKQLFHSLRSLYLRYENENPEEFREFKWNLCQGIGGVVAILSFLGISNLSDEYAVVDTHSLLTVGLALLAGFILLFAWRMWEAWKYEIDRPQRETDDETEEKQKIPNRNIESV